jgi:hypothetical protein
VWDPAFVTRLRTSLTDGGRILFERFVDIPEQPQPEGVRTIKPGQMRTILKDFAIEFYEETEDTADWGGPGSHVVRTLARKR